MNEQRERIADAAIAWAAALQRHEDARHRVLAKTDATMDDRVERTRTRKLLAYATDELLRACGKVGV